MFFFVFIADVPYEEEEDADCYISAVKSADERFVGIAQGKNDNGRNFADDMRTAYSLSSNSDDDSGNSISFRIFIGYTT